MNRKNICAVILAGGEGKRLGLSKPKPLFEILKTPVIDYVIQAVKNVVNEVIIVSSEICYEELCKRYPDFKNIMQKGGGYGTGWAIKSVIDELNKFEFALILQADDPLITEEDVSNILSTSNDDGTISITDSSSDEKSMEKVKIYDGLVEQISGEIQGYANIGRYLLNVEYLINAIESLNPGENGEYSLTEAINMMIRNGTKIGYIVQKKPINMNTPKEASRAKKIIQRRINEYWMEKGVYIDNPDIVDIGPKVSIGRGAEIYGVTSIFGNSEIGERTIVSNCVIADTITKKKCKFEFSNLINSKIDDTTFISFSVVENAIISRRVFIGPFAHIRADSVLEENSFIGNFVETKKTTMKKGSKARHLTYLGDTEVGINTNIGCGVITANYDGKTKFPTAIGDNCFIGCNSTLVAPVLIESNSYIGAGSTITDNVPSKTLAIGRARQVNKLGRAKNIS